VNTNRSSAPEWLDEVDASDHIVGRHLRSEIHRLGLRHRSTHILVFDRKGRVFLQRRSMNKDIHGGFWDTSAAGHVDPGESYDQCAMRELFEELGVAPQAAELQFLFRMTADETTGWEFVQVYRVTCDGRLLLNPAEIDDGRWLWPEQIDAWDETLGPLTNTFRCIWKRFRAMA
jgi:isopentenyldiphosphate isomerase